MTAYFETDIWGSIFGDTLLFWFPRGLPPKDLCIECLVLNVSVLRGSKVFKRWD